MDVFQVHSPISKKTLPEGVSGLKFTSWMNTRPPTAAACVLLPRVRGRFNRRVVAAPHPTMAASGVAVRRSVLLRHVEERGFGVN
jgi:hypothetical protein